MYVYIEDAKICHFTNRPLVLSFDCLLVPNMVCIIYLSAIVVYVVVSFLHVLVCGNSLYEDGVYVIYI